MAEEAQLKNIWRQRELGVDIDDKEIFRKITHSDIEYVANYFYPFIQVVNGGASFDGPLPLRFLNASTGWYIHDYGDAISTAAPHHLHEKHKDEDDGSEGGGGTIIAQQADTMAELALLIQQKGWASVELIAGSKLMQRYLWLETEKLGLKLNGFEPDQDDYRCAERLKKHAEAKKATLPHVVPAQELANR